MSGPRGNSALRKLFAVNVEEEFEGDGEDHGDEDGADEFGAASDDHAGTDARPDELADAHGQPGAVENFSGEGEEEEGTDVAGNVHHFGVAGGFGEVEAEAEHECDGPKAASAGAEKAIVKSQTKTSDEVEPFFGHAGMDVFIAESRTEGEVNNNGEQEDGDEAFEKSGVELLHDECAGGCADGGEDDSTGALAQGDEFGIGIMPGGTE
ncbi:MAG: hypothetical protein JWQ71_5018 [Pedosphaera sp.]|nr:hypothetical protein [Pedosphaera sp.]